MAEKTVKTQAAVLRSYKYGESDLILTLFGLSTGKVSAIAKGARKTKNRMRGTLQLFSIGNFLLYKGKSLYTVTQRETEEPFVILRQDLSKFAYASYCAEIIGELLREEEPNVPAFRLLSIVLSLIASGQEEFAARLFDMRMLKISGFLPEMCRCVKCGGHLPERPVFSCAEGGAVCCGGKGVQLGKDTLAVMNNLSKMDMQKTHRLRPSAKNLKEMEQVTRAYWETILEKSLKSVEFIERMRQFA